FGNPIGNEHILKSVLVVIPKKGTPTPIGGRYSTEQCGFHEVPVLLVHKEHVPGKLIVVSKMFHTHFLGLHIVVPLGGFEGDLILGEHVQGKQVGPSVPIDIGHIAAHGEAGGMAEICFKALGKGAVPVVEVVVVVLVEVVAHIDV